MVLTVAAVMNVQQAGAQGLIYVGYCDNMVANSSEGHVTGMSGVDVDIDMAIRLSKNVLAAYAGCRISGVNLGMPQAEGYPRPVKAWVRSSRDGDNLLEGSLSSPKQGWNLISGSGSYTIKGTEEELWVGVTFHQADKMNVVSFAGTTHADGCWIAKSGRWTDYSGKQWGSLSIEAVVEGTVPTHNLAIVEAKTKNALVKIGDPIEVSGTIKNLATTAAVRPYLLCSIDGREVKRYEFPGTVEYRSTADFAFQVPTDVVAADGTVDFSMELCWADGSQDEGMEDNTVHFTVEMVRELFYRKMVVEEGTGAWCGWCVYGIVGLREMKKAHPDTFIGIAIHSGDKYELAGYTPWIVKLLPSGFPGCVVNRGGKEELPRLPELQSLYNAMPNVADAGVHVWATYKDGKITFESTTRFFRDMNKTDYRMVYVVVENQLPIHQKNYYADGARGEMGGFEKLPGDCDVFVDDVARGIYPSVTGQTGGFPASVRKGTTYHYRCTTDMPAYADAKNLEVIALLIDGRTGEVAQADKTPYIFGLNAEEPEGLDPVSINAGEQSPSPIYDLQGRRVTSPKATRGLLIQDRRVRL